MSKSKKDPAGKQATNSESSDSPTIVVLGNPNTGKSTLFNVLTGVRQQTGNYPGVTVERRSGKLLVSNKQFHLVDLPGTYSLSPQSPDEMLTINALLGRTPSQHEPDLVLCVVDANNLERNLFVVSQVLDLHLPTVIALNMTDIAERNGIQIDADKLGEILGVCVVPIQAKNRKGIDALKNAIEANIGKKPLVEHDPFSTSIKSRLSHLKDACPDDCSLKRFAMTRMLFDRSGYIVEQFKDQVDQEFAKVISAEQSRIEKESGQTVAENESQARFDWIKAQLDSVIQKSNPRNWSWTNRLDKWLTHPIWGLIIAVVTMVILFQLVFWIAEPASAAIDWSTSIAGDWISSIVPEGAFQSLLIDGVVNGVGSVLIFLPQIAFLFFILAVLEDCGYLARAAFLTDKYLSRLGLSGITLIPLLSSFACAIPGIMATRVIKNPRERLITILVAPLMSCSARLPVYVLLIAAFVTGPAYLKGVTMLGMYLIGIVTAIIVAWILKTFVLKTGTSSFVMELPSYKVPSIRNIWQRMFDGSWAFVRDAGTIIFAVTILVWAAAYFPKSDSNIPPAIQLQQTQLQEAFDLSTEGSEDRNQIQSELAKIDNQIAALHLENSYLGRAGHFIEPVVKPLGWDWRIGSAAIASFPAREVIVSTLGVLFGLGADTEAESESLQSTLKNAKWQGDDPRWVGKPLFTLPVALSIMVFFALCAQCVSTLAVIKRETNSYFWPAFTFTYMTVLAYVAALLTFQIGSRIL